LWPGTSQAQSKSQAGPSLEETWDYIVQLLSVDGDSYSYTSSKDDKEGTAILASHSWRVSNVHANACQLSYDMLEKRSTNFSLGGKTETDQRGESQYPLELDVASFIKGTANRKHGGSDEGADQNGSHSFIFEDGVVFRPSKPITILRHRTFTHRVP